MVGRCFVDHAPIICTNIQDLGEKTYLRIHEAQSCQLEQMILLPLFIGNGPELEPLGVLEMTGFIASFEPVASHIPQLLAAHGLSTCNLHTPDCVISSHLSSFHLSSNDFGWAWGADEDRSSNPGSEAPAPGGGLISEFMGKRLQAAALSLGSHGKEGASAVRTGSDMPRLGSERLSDNAIKTSVTTPASLAISLCNALLLGEEIDMNTVLLVRSALMTGVSASIYEPVDPMEDMELGRDAEVGNALRQMLTRNLTACYSIDNIGSQSSQASDAGLARVLENATSEDLADSLRRPSMDNGCNSSCVSESGFLGILQRVATHGDLASAIQDLPERGGKKFWRMSSGSISQSPQDKSTTTLSSTFNRSMDGEANSGPSSLDRTAGVILNEAATSIRSMTASPTKASPKDFTFRPPNVPVQSVHRATSLVSLLLSSPSEELVAVLSRSDDWTFDSFELDRVTCGKPLSCLSFFLFKRMGLIDKLRLNETRLCRWLQRIEDGYNSASYHNKIHAADVLRVCHVTLNRGGVLETLESYSAADALVPREIRLLCCYFAAIVHDFEHPGLTNDFMIKSNSKLALMYNDASPLENHHLAASFSLLRQEPFAFLPLDKKLAAILRRDVIQLVLATDMKAHFSVLGLFSSMISDSQSDSSSAQNPQHMSWDNDAQLLALKMVLKVSDLGHLANKEVTHHAWVSRLEQEMFAQGDKEKALGISISPLMDRTKAGVSRSQIFFFNVVAIPLFTQLSQAFPGTKEILDLLLLNFNRWAEIETSKARTI
jgi:hypothetical protein